MVGGLPGRPEREDRAPGSCRFLHTARPPVRSLHDSFLPVIREIQVSLVEPAYLYILAERLRLAGQVVSSAPPDATTLDGEKLW